MTPRKRRAAEGGVGGPTGPTSRARTTSIAPTATNPATANANATATAITTTTSIATAAAAATKAGGSQARGSEVATAVDVDRSQITQGRDGRDLSLETQPVAPTRVADASLGLAPAPTVEAGARPKKGLFRPGARRKKT